PRIGINYRPSATWSLYANYGEAFSMNNGMSRTLETFEPETAKSYEVGAKWQCSDTDALSLAWFDMRKNNVLMTDAIDPNYEAAVGEISSRGIEFDLSVQLHDQLKLSANYAWVNAEVS
ncbi:TonB-dependent receptor, partial [Acinetobacter baumannii]